MPRGWITTTHGLYNQAIAVLVARHWPRRPRDVARVLRDRQWAHDLSADNVSTQCQAFGVFGLSVELTEEGFANIAEVFSMIWYYIDTFN